MRWSSASSLRLRCACGKRHERPPPPPPPASGAWRPNPRGGSAGEREHQLVEALHKRRGVVELTALGQRRLIEQDVTPIREPAAVGFVFQTIHDRMAGIDL